jgi:hypothetical protein
MKNNKARTLLLAAIAIGIIQGCTTRLDQAQVRELELYEEKGLSVQEKSASTAAMLGILPIAGYAYTGHYVLAVTTVPLYLFLGPLWMPFDAHAAAERRNYYASRVNVEREKAKALRALDHKLEDKTLSYEQHLREQRTIETRYSSF